MIQMMMSLAELLLSMMTQLMMMKTSTTIVIILFSMFPPHIPTLPTPSAESPKGLLEPIISDPFHAVKSASRNETPHI
jgi:hypothetical protein